MPRTRRAAIVLVAAALLVTGCTGTTPDDDDVTPVPSVATEAPVPQAPVPDVPVRKADLASQPEGPVAPVALTIEALDVTVPVEPVGVQDDGQMEIPPLAEVAGWYRYGSSPSQGSGTTVIAAHVDSVASAGLGPFARLADLQPGARVAVTLADGTAHTYTVTSIEQTPKTAVTWSDVFVRDGSDRLVLVTCGGTFQQQVRSYSDNVIVIAEPE